MSIQSEIDRITAAISAAYEKVALKGGTASEPYLVANLENAIASIPEASDPILQSKTVSPSTSAQTVKPDSGYDGLSQVTVNAMTVADQATPSISVSSAGLITASATQTAGYVSVGTKSSTKQLTTQAAKTVTPATSDQTAVASGVYTTGAVTVKGDANLKPENIANGVSIFGVLGTLAGGGGLPDGITAVATGTFTPASDTYDEFYPHNLGVMPRLLYYYTEDDINIADFGGYAVAGVMALTPYITEGNYPTVFFKTVWYGYQRTSGVGLNNNSAWHVNLDMVEATVMNSNGFAPGLSGSTNYPVKAGVTYRWEAYAVD